MLDEAEKTCFRYSFFFFFIDKKCVVFFARRLIEMVNEIDANVWSTSAPKMERASIFLHVASGILKIASLEAEKSENW